MIRKAICKCLLVGRGSADNSLVLVVPELMHNEAVLQRRLENIQKVEAIDPSCTQAKFIDATDECITF